MEKGISNVFMTHLLKVFKFKGNNAVKQRKENMSKAVHLP